MTCCKSLLESARLILDGKKQQILRITIKGSVLIILLKEKFLTSLLKNL